MPVGGLAVKQQECTPPIYMDFLETVQDKKKKSWGKKTQTNK